MRFRLPSLRRSKAVICE